ncbi:MAG: histidine kinase [Chitinophagaceae bacterium]|nr:histidine kinase [Chitinophagaceae bacterium]
MAYTQHSDVKDSLLHMLKTAKDDENKVLLLIRIGQEYENSDLEKSKSFYRQARALGKKINYPLTEVKFISNYTFTLNMQGKYDSSLYWNLRGIEEAKLLNDDVHLAKAYFNTGTSYNYMSDYQSAVENYQNGLKLFEKIDDKFFTAQANDILQTLYMSLKQYDRAKEHGKKAVAAFRNLNDPKMLAYALTNSGVTYGSSNQKDSSLVYHIEAGKIARSINDEVLLATIELNIADVYLWKKQYEESKRNYESVLKSARKNNLPESEATALRGLAYYYMHKGDYENSLQFASEALAVSEKNKLWEEKTFSLDQLATLAYISKDIDKAQIYETRSKELRDSLLNEQILTHTINTEKKFELDKKNTQLKLQEEEINRKNLLNGLLIGGLGSLLLISVLGYRNYSHRKKIQEQRIKELETEKQLLATQSLLKGQEDERSRMAKDLHDGLGGMLSGVKLQLGAMKGNLILTGENGMLFNNALHKLDESISEMRRVAHNMMPEALIKLGLQQALQDYCDGINASRSFTVNTGFYGLEQRMNAATEVTVYRIVQELVNNVVKHAAASTLLVQVMRQAQSLNITVEDNGQGFDATHWKEKHTAGLQNILSRVHYLGGRMDIQSHPGKGTSVYIECTIEDNG